VGMDSKERRQEVLEGKVLRPVLGGEGTFGRTGRLGIRTEGS